MFRAVNYIVCLVMLSALGLGCIDVLMNWKHVVYLYQEYWYLPGPFLLPLGVGYVIGGFQGILQG